ncbi:MAG TPA: N-acetylmuramoyl-L-alanine amidase [Solirubrobacteraceae bacterium]|nr:N-acetylmuramoyl-L-alanine amidase [Solirubrobacteraceae bacterium]
MLVVNPPIAHPARARPLAGTVIGIDPGHNGRNYSDPSFINHLVWNGRAMEPCDTTGTATDAGYSEAQFNWNVAGFLTRDLRADGARVVLTRHSNSGVGPCVNTRARILDRARVNVAVDIHADGGPPSGRGFAILEPVPDSVNAKVVSASDRFARTLRTAFLAGTGMPVSTYDGVDGLQPRDDLAGLNLTTVPKVLIECGNMRNGTDARLLSSGAFQRRAAAAMLTAIIGFLGR